MGNFKLARFQVWPYRKSLMTVIQTGISITMQCHKVWCYMNTLLSNYNLTSSSLTKSQLSLSEDSFRSKPFQLCPSQLWACKARDCLLCNSLHLLIPLPSLPFCLPCTTLALLSPLSQDFQIGQGAHVALGRRPVSSCLAKCKIKCASSAQEEEDDGQLGMAGTAEAAKKAELKLAIGRWSGSLVVVNAGRLLRAWILTTGMLQQR